MSNCPNCNTPVIMFNADEDICPQCGERWFAGENLPPLIKYNSGCGGPNYNNFTADEATEKVLLMLATDYKVLDSDFNKDDKLRAEYRANLRHAVHELFKLDCWEGF